MKLLNKLSAVFDRAIEVMAFIGGLITAFITLLVGVSVFTRYFFNYPIGFVIEFGKYAMVYITFLAAAWVLRQEGHVKIEFLLTRFTPRTQSTINAVTSAASVIPCLILVWFGGVVTVQFFQTHYTTVELIALPEFILIVIIPIGMLMLSIQFVRRSLSFWRKRKDLVRDGLNINV